MIKQPAALAGFLLAADKIFSFKRIKCVYICKQVGYYKHINNANGAKQMNAQFQLYYVAADNQGGIVMNGKIIFRGNWAQLVEWQMNTGIWID